MEMDEDQLEKYLEALNAELTLTQASKKFIHHGKLQLQKGILSTVYTQMGEGHGNWHVHVMMEKISSETHPNPAAAFFRVKTQLLWQDHTSQ